ncbi:Uncharacterised protein [Mycobacteroides abscessus subsp. abscessus]|nr:Uncharacterised protein [Mycobacteroides abscessus subsp. abscessus]SHS87483.1 Uncharacterised protein [Mycobacteroides abscessus subsp. abscessus]SHT71042.1 Uncharacterised protein [Mycobacteroides abscessus subsp. abscessus]SHU92097.1 Uncharacterised protein [Mycobacteroides abscessus subsp. abscessus]SHX08172.1 Uncharacterised protein [Mycobacteroides abscessus subsp. abscessus]
MRLDNLPLDPAKLFLFGTGGVGRAQRVYRDGTATEEPVLVDGGTLRKLTGLAGSYDGNALEGADFRSVTPMDSVPAGTVFKAAGRCTLSVRADAKSGFGPNARPRGVLALTVYIERLEPVGSVNDLVRQSSSGPAASKRGGDAA